MANELGALAQWADLCVSVAIAIFIFRNIDNGRWVRGVDLESCRREVQRLQRRLERAGVLAHSQDDDHHDLPLNGDANARHPRGP